MSITLYMNNQQDVDDALILLSHIALAPGQSNNMFSFYGYAITLMASPTAEGSFPENVKECVKWNLDILSPHIERYREVKTNHSVLINQYVDEVCAAIRKSELSDAQRRAEYCARDFVAEAEAQANVIYARKEMLTEEAKVFIFPANMHPNQMLAFLGVNCRFKDITLGSDS
jgi:hypothetical protein